MRSQTWKKLNRIRIYTFLFLAVTLFGAGIIPNSAQALVDDTDLVVYASEGERKNGKVICNLSLLDGTPYGEIVIYDDYRFKIRTDDGVISGHLYDGVTVLQDVVAEGMDHAPNANPDDNFAMFAYEIERNQTSQWNTTGVYNNLTGFMTRCGYLLDDEGHLIKCIGGFYVFRFGDSSNG